MPLAVYFYKQIGILGFLTFFRVALVEITFSTKRGKNLARQIFFEKFKEN